MEDPRALEPLIAMLKDADSEVRAAADPTVFDITGNGNTPVTATFAIEPFAFGDVGAIQWQISLGQMPAGITLSTTSGQGVAGSTQPIDVTVDPTVGSGNYGFTVTAKAGNYRSRWNGVIVVQ